MRPAAALALALLLGCTGPGRLLEVVEEDGQPDTAYAALKRHVREMDSLEQAQRPICTVTWRSDLGDSLRVCDDPKPPRAPRVIRKP